MLNYGHKLQNEVLPGELSWTHPVKVYLSNTRSFSLYSGPKSLFSLIYFHFQIVPPDEKTTITATFTVLSYNQIVEIKTTLYLLEEIHQAILKT